MVLGDMHGSTHSVGRALEASKHHDYSKIVQVGDFGLWDHLAMGVKFLDDINVGLAKYGRKIYAVGGNHENWDHWNWYVENMPKDEYGFAIVRSHIMLAPRVHRWTWDGKNFLGVAGAASIDKDIRLMDENNGSPKQWWWQEQITDEEIDGIASSKVVQTDYLITHDCSNRTPWGFQLIPDFDSQIHRQRIDRVLERTEPGMHFHGHMHHKYDWSNRVSGDHWTQTYGLTCNDQSNVWGILDMESNEFRFQPLKW
jgi:hypothetical protein